MLNRPGFIWILMIMLILVVVPPLLANEYVYEITDEYVLEAGSDYFENLSEEELEMLLDRQARLNYVLFKIRKYTHDEPAGMYFDVFQGGTIHISFKNQETVDLLNEVKSEFHEADFLYFYHAEYSIDELKKLQETISQHIRSLGFDVQSIGLSLKEQKIMITIRNLTQRQERFLEFIYGTELITVRPSLGEAYALNAK